MKKTMQTYLNILKYPEHRYETLFFCARTWHTLMHTMKRSLKQYRENCGSYFDMVFPMVFRVFPPPWRPMAIRHLHGLQDLCRLFAVLLRWCSLAHLYTPVTKTIPNQEEAWWKQSPTTTSFFVNRTGLRSNITFDLWQIYRDTCGCGPHILVADVQVPPSAVGPKLLKTSRARPKPPWLSFLSSTSVPLLWTKNNLNRTCTYTHTHLHVSLCNHHMYNSGMYQLIVIRI